MEGEMGMQRTACANTRWSSPKKKLVCSGCRNRQGGTGRIVESIEDFPRHDNCGIIMSARLYLDDFVLILDMEHL
jgi:hypothetical protein